MTSLTTRIRGCSGVTPTTREREVSPRLEISNMNYYQPGLHEFIKDDHNNTRVCLRF
jgi:hypothetical protein